MLRFRLHPASLILALCIPAMAHVPLKIERPLILSVMHLIDNNIFIYLSQCALLRVGHGTGAGWQSAGGTGQRERSSTKKLWSGC
jgi:hypothetical protein